jgi:hypothetical protein
MCLTHWGTVANWSWAICPYVRVDAIHCPRNNQVSTGNQHQATKIRSSLRQVTELMKCLIIYTIIILVSSIYLVIDFLSYVTHLSHLHSAGGLVD